VAPSKSGPGLMHLSDTTVGWRAQYDCVFMEPTMEEYEARPDLDDPDLRYVPKYKATSGRPRTNRVKSSAEVVKKKQSRCGACFNFGHRKSDGKCPKNLMMEKVKKAGVPSESDSSESDSSESDSD